MTRKCVTYRLLTAILQTTCNRWPVTLLTETSRWINSLKHERYDSLKKENTLRHRKKYSVRRGNSDIISDLSASRDRRDRGNRQFLTAVRASSHERVIFPVIFQRRWSNFPLGDAFRRFEARFPRETERHYCRSASFSAVSDRPIEHRRVISRPCHRPVGYCVSNDGDRRARKVQVRFSERRESDRCPKRTLPRRKFCHRARAFSFFFFSSPS